MHLNAVVPYGRGGDDEDKHQATNWGYHISAAENWVLAHGITVWR